MPLRASLLAILLCLPCTAFAQSDADAGKPTRDDGIRAVVAGDYAKGVQILRPLAEEAAPADPVAQFFMALLYYSGLGVKFNQSHACSLFLNASSVDNPFADTSSRLVRFFEEGGLGGNYCPKAWSVPYPATFVFAPNHRLTITSDGATLFFSGIERAVSATEPNPYIVFEPSVYAAVDVPGTPPLRRHFIESFVWFHDPSGPWALTWTLHEVVGLEYIERKLGDMLNVIAPSDAPRGIDVPHVVVLRAQPDGSVEYTVQQWNGAGHGLIPPLETK